MARRKEIRTGHYIKYIPTGRLADLEKLANEFPHIKDKTVALYKYVELFSSIVERCWNTESEFVPISQRVQKNVMKMDNVFIKKILQDLIENNFLAIDKSTFELGVKSYSYKPLYSTLSRFIIYKNFINKKTDSRLSEVLTTELDKDCKIYQPVVTKIKFDESIFNAINSNYDYDVYNIGNEILNDINNPNLNMLLCTCLVPCENVCKKSVVKESPVCTCLVAYEVLTEKIPTELIAVNKILSSGIKVSPRKNSAGRVYTTLTNLPRIYRPFLRLNGKALIGFDIANSQPLIAAIAFRRYSENEYGSIKPDVEDYQKNCEAGKFYEYFMELNNIDTNCEDTRTKFKAEFFGKVFYTKEIEKENYLKTQFKEKYPTCYEAIFNIKGGLYSKEYKKFPVLMTEFETSIMFATNIELIKMGYDVVNIFDSLYSDGEEALIEAKKIVTEKFKEYGICPNLKDINYRCKVAKSITINKYAAPIRQSIIKKKGSNKKQITSQGISAGKPIKEKMIIQPKIEEQEIPFENYTDEQLKIKSHQQRWSEDHFFVSNWQIEQDYKIARYDAIQKLYGLKKAI